MLIAPGIMIPPAAVAGRGGYAFVDQSHQVRSLRMDEIYAVLPPRYVYSVFPAVWSGCINSIAFDASSFRKPATGGLRHTLFSNGRHNVVGAARRRWRNLRLRMALLDLQRAISPVAGPPAGRTLLIRQRNLKFCNSPTDACISRPQFTANQCGCWRSRRFLVPIPGVGDNGESASSPIRLHDQPAFNTRINIRKLFTHAHGFTSRRERRFQRGERYRRLKRILHPAVTKGLKAHGLPLQTIVHDGMPQPCRRFQYIGAMSTFEPGIP